MSISTVTGSGPGSADNYGKELLDYLLKRIKELELIILDLQSNNSNPSSNDLPLSGGTMTGDINLGGSNILNVTEITSDGEPSILFNNNDGYLMADGGEVLAWRDNRLTLKGRFDLDGNLINLDEGGIGGYNNLSGIVTILQHDPNDGTSLGYQNEGIQLNGPTNILNSINSTQYKINNIDGVTNSVTFRDQSNNQWVLEVTNGIVTQFTQT